MSVHFRLPFLTLKDVICWCHHSGNLAGWGWLSVSIIHTSLNPGHSPWDSGEHMRDSRTQWSTWRGEGPAVFVVGKYLCLYWCSIGIMLCLLEQNCDSFAFSPFHVTLSSLSDSRLGRIFFQSFFYTAVTSFTLTQSPLHTHIHVLAHPHLWPT